MKKNETKVTNLIILTLVNYARDYPWASYIANSLSQFDLILPELMQSKAKERKLRKYPSTLTQMIALWNSHPKSLTQRKLNPILPSTSSI